MIPALSILHATSTGDDAAASQYANSFASEVANLSQNHHKIAGFKGEVIPYFIGKAAGEMAVATQQGYVKVQEQLEQAKKK